VQIGKPRTASAAPGGFTCDISRLARDLEYWKTLGTDTPVAIGCEYTFRNLEVGFAEPGERHVPGIYRLTATPDASSPSPPTARREIILAPDPFDWSVSEPCARLTRAVADYFPPPEAMGGWRSLITANVAPTTEQKAAVRDQVGLNWDMLRVGWSWFGWVATAS
jgi:hypothetical protein